MTILSRFVCGDSSRPQRAQVRHLRPNHDLYKFLERYARAPFEGIADLCRIGPSEAAVGFANQTLVHSDVRSPVQSYRSERGFAQLFDRMRFSSSDHIIGGL